VVPINTIPEVAAVVLTDRTDMEITTAAKVVVDIQVLAQVTVLMPHIMVAVAVPVAIQIQVTAATDIKVLLSYDIEIDKV
jgi:hypothetical protein